MRTWIEELAWVDQQGFAPGYRDRQHEQCLMHHRWALEEAERKAYEELGRRYEDSIRLNLQFKDYLGAFAEGINASLEEL